MIAKDKRDLVVSPDGGEMGRVYIETYGCQMNFSDSEVIASVLVSKGYAIADEVGDADIVFLNTCAVRDNAEQKIWKRLESLALIKKKNPDLIVGLVGCMAERLKKEVFEEGGSVVDIVAGPDAYRSLPNLIGLAGQGQRAANTFLSVEETYSEITPVRRQGVTAFLSIMRGCDNMCTFCVVPFTRGRERSRPVRSILSEAARLARDGVREITLLGQNVNSYYDESERCTFAELLGRVSVEVDGVRIRFTTSNPHDVTDSLIDVMASRFNVCNSFHLPAQSGSTVVLEKMKRKYSREAYLEIVSKIREKVPQVALTTDIISGFCSETEQDHEGTLSLLQEVGFDYAYTFMYSERPNTFAARQFMDDVPLEVKRRRLAEIVAVQQEISRRIFNEQVGTYCDVLVERESKRSDDMWMGRDDKNRVVVFPKKGVARIGDVVRVLIQRATSATLVGEMC